MLERKAGRKLVQTRDVWGKDFSLNVEGLITLDGFCLGFVVVVVVLFCFCFLVFFFEEQSCKLKWIKSAHRTAVLP